MNKVEFQQKLDEGIRLIDEGNFQDAVDLLDYLNLDAVRDTKVLQNVAKAYEKCRRYEDAEDLLLQARDAAPRSRGVLFHLCTLAIKSGNLDEAMKYYTQFCEVAKDDSERFVLQYRIAQAENKSDDELIAILENFKSEEPDDRWMYELAKLYAINDRMPEALEICDEISLWFYNGKYVKLAKELRAYLTGEPVEEEPEIEEEPKQEPETAKTEPSDNEAPAVSAFDNETPPAETVETETPGNESFTNETTDNGWAGESVPPSVVIPMDAWESDSTGETATDFETETETENETETEAKAESGFRNEFRSENETEFEAETETETAIEEETKEETLTGISGLIAELPVLEAGERPTKEELYRVVPGTEGETAKEEEQPVVIRITAEKPVTPIPDSFEEETLSTNPFEGETLISNPFEEGTIAGTPFDEEDIEKSAVEEIPPADNAPFLIETEIPTEPEPFTQKDGSSESGFDMEELNRYTASRFAEAAAVKTRHSEEKAPEAEPAKEETQVEPEIQVEAEKEETPVEPEIQAEAEKEETPAEYAPEETPVEPEFKAEPVFIAAPEEEVPAEPEEEPEKTADFEEETEIVMSFEEETPAEPATEAEPQEETPAEPEFKAEPEVIPEEEEPAAEEPYDPLSGIVMNPEDRSEVWHFFSIGLGNDAVDKAKEEMRIIADREHLGGLMKLTKLPAAKLAGFRIRAVFDQFSEKMVIIENASSLADDQLMDFAELLGDGARSLLICLADNEEGIRDVLTRVPALKEVFTTAFRTDDDLFLVMKNYLEQEDAAFTPECEPIVREYIRTELTKDTYGAKEEALRIAKQSLKVAEHSGLFGLFSGHVDEDGYLHITEKDFRKALKK